MFNGADTNGMDSLIRETGAVELPLSVSYRCPKSHITLAQQIDPQIECAETAVDGTINDLVFGKFVERCNELNRAGQTSLAMGRKNSTVIFAALSLLANQIKIIVRGRDFGAMLSNIVKKTAYSNPSKKTTKIGFDFRNFPVHLRDWAEKELAQMQKRNASESAKQAVLDKQQSLQIMYNAVYCDGYTIEQLINYIESFFDDGNGNRGAVILSTVHRAKGLEADVTFVLNPHEMPLIWKGQSEDERTQEMNIKFVILTRSKREMNFVILPDQMDE